MPRDERDRLFAELYEAWQINAQAWEAHPPIDQRTGVSSHSPRMRG